MTKQVKKCYMCEEDGVTSEHVPPKCIFPEIKDSLDGKNLKLQLITVPSCHEHNTAKSNNDVYFQFVITVSILSNQYADHQLKTKLKRAIERSPHLYNSFVENNIVTRIEEINGLDFNTIAFQVDTDRLLNSIEHISYGLYYLEFNETYTGEMDIGIEGILNFDHLDLMERTQKLIDNFECLLAEQPWKGQNPDIFLYKIEKNNIADENKTYLLLKFYENLRVSILMK
ncbi:hypothetical protein [Morganella psychrotolerans]|uniref:HNH endonuclease n=1 Tax=Morganella psychrotolerans TaxID=368603 RepID=A0A1B8H2C3_9GAMM|nr:hypothetical protein [Morganella psychrotolerans]OBU03213.1 hypothetical protein AYY18_11200 [Morganella psychrotolerans]